MPIFDIPYNQFSEEDEGVLRKLLSSFGRRDLRVIEIGCWTGKVTSILSEYANTIYCVDNFLGTGSILEDFAKGKYIRDIFEKNMQELGIRNKILLSDLSQRDPLYYKACSDIDFAFIDGDHRYHQVSKDIESVYQHIVKDGILSGHDFDRYLHEIDFPISEHLEEDQHNGFHCGVIKSVTERFGNPQKEGKVWWIVK